MTQFVFGNFFATELTNGVSSAATVLTVPPSATPRLPAIAVGEDKQAMLTLWDGVKSPEIVACTLNAQNGNLTVTRAQEGTTAQNWPAGTQVISTLTAAVINAAMAAYFDINVVLAANFLKLTGGTLTGALVLSGSPGAPLQAATKAYVDSVQGSFLAISGGTMTGPINMNGQRILTLPAPISGAEPATKTYADGITTAVNAIFADRSGVLASTGSSSAFAVTSQSTYSALINGLTFTYTPHLTNAAGATMAFAGLPAKPIITDVAVPAGFLPAGIPVTLVYISAVDSWRVLNVHQSDLDFGPSDFKYSARIVDHGRWYLCDGRAVARTGDTAALFAQIGTNFGPGDNVTTYNIPDCRGRVMAGLDNMTGVNANRLTSVVSNSSTIGSTGGAQLLNLTIAQLPVVTPAGTIPAPSGTISSITPSGSVSAPAVNISESAHDHGAGGLLNAVSTTNLSVSGGATAIVNAVNASGGGRSATNLTGITAALASNPILTGNAVTPVFSGNAVSFSGTAFGSGANVPTVQPVIMVNIFVRY